MTLIEITTGLAVINCGACGGTYAINERYRQERQNKGETWHCPYCNCEWGYTGNSDNEKLRRELVAERERLASARRMIESTQAEAEHFRKSRDTMKGLLHREKKRVGNGVCPCCNRSFQNLKAHMKTKHPNHGAEEVKA